MMKMDYISEQLRCVHPAYSAQLVPALDPSVDDQIGIYFAGSKTRWSIQIGAGYYAANEIRFKDREVE